MEVLLFNISQVAYLEVKDIQKILQRIFLEI